MHFNADPPPKNTIKQNLDISRCPSLHCLAPPGNTKSIVLVAACHSCQPILALVKLWVLSFVWLMLQSPPPSLSTACLQCGCTCHGGLQKQHQPTMSVAPNHLPPVSGADLLLQAGIEASILTSSCCQYWAPLCGYWERQHLFVNKVLPFCTENLV